VVAVRGLVKVFKDFWGRPKARAVDNIDFEVRRGEGVRAVGSKRFGEVHDRKNAPWPALSDARTHRGLRAFAAAREDEGAHRLSA
jgi:hypothetical protein